MSDTATPTPEIHGHCGGNRFHGARRGGLGLLVFALFAGGALGYAAKSYAHGPMSGHRGFMSAPLDPAAMDERAERMVKHFAVEVDATSEQRDKLSAIAKGVAKDLAPLRDKARNARNSAVALLKAATIDRAALEQLRSEQLQLADATTRRITQALADAAEVLTPEQRAKLAERFEKRMGRWQRG
jgi:Spy/CpxP family protein refolding chaperone